MRLSSDRHLAQIDIFPATRGIPRVADLFPVPPAHV